MGRKVIDLSGRRFGRLTVLHRGPSGAHNHTYWFCRCDCGAETLVYSYSLRIGGTQSCGCLQKEFHNWGTSPREGKRGMPEHQSWRAMIQRCENQNHKAFYRYGGRGIKVCARWRDNFDAFLVDVGPRPSRRHTLDRINTNGDYERGNVRWSTVSEQNNNTRRCRYIPYKGTMMSVADAVRAAGNRVLVNTARDRIQRGVPPDEAVERPAR